MVTPFGGDLRWQYGTYAYASGVTYRQVQSRQMTPSSGASPYTWNLTLNSNSATIADTGAGTQKNWTFQTSGAFAGLVSTYEEHGTTGTTLLHKDYVWAQDGAANVYLNSVASTLDPGTSYAAQTKTVQTLDTYGNILQSQIYDYGAASPTRTYNYGYLNQPLYNSRYIRNRLLAVYLNGGLIVSNAYDLGFNSTCTAQQGWIQDRPGLWMHDAAYNTNFSCRGNLTNGTTLGDTQTIYYDIGGIPWQKSDSTGMYYNLSTTTNTNYSLPEMLAPNGNNSLATTFAYSSAFALNSIIDPNGASTTTNSDGYGRPLSTKIAMARRPITPTASIPTRRRRSSQIPPARFGLRGPHMMASGARSAWKAATMGRLSRSWIRNMPLAPARLWGRCPRYRSRMPQGARFTGRVTPMMAAAALSPLPRQTGAGPLTNTRATTPRLPIPRENGNSKLWARSATWLPSVSQTIT